ncbi:hypothetical protein SeMB42_g03113 [Synchytrium endobioticum]|uniref:Uncharacterized protein n=1 Tax=Synchytrium endobioticum TaxID=286115 RepID=A0A507CKP2_9FUNG|nr:hypothetical protein SeLEV6574_g06628 [Synchytrium endobioticum]TPX48166.1 hypothetical protein SeMB42_g03113 [Synchytrium endobioticum]
MGKAKKHAKGRLDKYYQMAKEQGYRARSAFKLIQLNRKYNVLGKAKCLLDLCAAPGGWLQVASKYMPKPSVIIGVDLGPIKSIPGVTTLVEDITTAKCRASLKAELKQWKADVVLHDGAPNVGTSWLQDAFSQNELVLSSLKLATEFLMPHGTFITKVFRSKDYNKLLWVFHQLFKTVDATKPASSRNVSAEIFVICRDYIGNNTKKGEMSKLLDPRVVFEDGGVADGENSDDEDPLKATKKKREKQGALLNDLLHPEKRKRHREGYEDGDYTLHHVEKVSTFIYDRDYLSVLSRAHTLDFDADEDGRGLAKHPLTTDDIRSACRDLRVLGKKDFKELLKWRQHIRISLSLDKNKEPKPTDQTDQTEEHGLPMDDESLAEELKKRADQVAKKTRRERRKEFDRKNKSIKRMQLGMDVPMDIGIDAANESLGMIAGTGSTADLLAVVPNETTGDADEAFKTTRRKEILESLADDISDDESETHPTTDSDDESSYDSDLEKLSRLRSLESEVEVRQQQLDERLLERNPIAKLKKDREAKKKENAVSSRFEEWYGIQYDEKVKKNVMDENGGSESDDGSDNENATDGNGDDAEMALDAPSSKEQPKAAPKLSKNAQLFFDNPIFKDLDSDKKGKSGSNKGNFDSELVVDESSSDEDEDISKMLKKKRKMDAKEVAVECKRQKIDASQDNGGEDGFEAVPATVRSNDDTPDDEHAIMTAQAYTLAQKLLRKSSRRDLVDDGYNRYSFNDRNGLPDWFAKDEGKHNKPQIPASKESVSIMRQRLRALNARPIKKVAEAKFRKTLRTARRIQKAQAKSQVIENDPDLPDKSKLQTISDLMEKAKKAGNGAVGKNGKKKDMPKLVIAKGRNKAMKGRPKGVRGRYKMVDARMKKEVRAEKRKAAKSKGRRK